MMFKIQIIIHIYNGKVCECCSQTSKQVNIVVTRMRGPSGPEILVHYKLTLATYCEIFYLLKIKYFYFVVNKVHCYKEEESPPELQEKFP